MFNRLMLVAALTLPFAAFAQTETPTSNPAASAAKSPAAKSQKAQRFDALDTNKDGFISRQEAAPRPQLVKNFDSIDKNRDGKLSKQEMTEARQARRAAKQGAAPVQKG
ncbi:MAG: EF-hand domain-containing protein [Burkholderiales bacterium]